MGTINTEYLRRASELLDEANYYMQKAFAGVEGPDAVTCYDLANKIEDVIADIDDIHDTEEAVARRIAEESRV